MAKQTKIKVKEDAKKGHGPKQPIHSITLKIGSWKRSFPEEQNMIMIAQALNYCACLGGMNIAGYLITKKRVCLVLEIDSADINQMLLMFYESVRKEIKQYRDRHRNMILKTNYSHEQVENSGSFTDLFIQYPGVSDHLVKLITGQQDNLEYYNPHLARLKDWIHNYNFCSARDYSGARSPVIVKLPGREKDC